MENRLSDLRDTIARQLVRWEVPSVSVAVVKDGEVLLADGIGLRDGKSRAADGGTLYQIASCSKAFTAAGAALLATEGKLDLDTPVADYLPGFRLRDDYAGSHLTARDFLSHRSGLPRHEYAWYGTGFTRAELMDNLKELPLSAPIRYRYQYSNFNYLIVGCLIEAVSGMPFEEFLRTRLLRPLGMEGAAVFSDEMQAAPNHALPFDRAEDYALRGIRQIPFYRSPAERPGVGDPTAAAGCVNACAADMAKWLRFHLDLGRTGQGQLIREDLMALLHAPHIQIRSGGGTYAPQRSDTAYGLGWFVHRYRGYRMLQHGGHIPGFSSEAALLPDLGLGIFVSANMSGTYLPPAIVHDIADRFLGAGDGEWYDRLLGSNQEDLDAVKARVASFGGRPIPGTRPSHPLADYAGDYEAPGYRRFRVTLESGRLTADFNTFTARLCHHHYDSFATEDTVGELPGGLVLTFGTDPAGAVRTLSVTLGDEAGLAPTVFTKQGKQGEYNDD